MAEEKFILLNLEDTKSKELAQAISSETARKILDLLSEKALSETDIAKKLNIPLPTAHYNIKQLLKANIIEIEDFLWSEKGKKIQLYKLANKLIIIAPKTSSPSFLNKIKEIVPVVLSGLVASLGIYIYQLVSIDKTAQSETLVESARIAQPEALMAESNLNIYPTTSVDIVQNYALWFFLGVISLIILYLVYFYWKTRKH